MSFLAYNPYVVVCFVDEELIIWEYVLYVFCGFGGGKFSYLHDDN